MVHRAAGKRRPGRFLAQIVFVTTVSVSAPLFVATHAANGETVLTSVRSAGVVHTTTTPFHANDIAPDAFNDR